jgi:hypothetical protein
VPHVNNRDRIINLNKPPRTHVGGNEFHLITLEWLCDLPLRHGEEVRARIMFEARTAVANAALALDICDLGSRPILSYHSDLQEAYRPNLSRAGAYAVDVEIDALPLHPDTYTLDIWCGAHGVGGTFDFVRTAVQFEVLPGPTTPDFLTVGTCPRVHLNSKWVWNLEPSLTRPSKSEPRNLAE